MNELGMPTVIDDAPALNILTTDEWRIWLKHNNGTTRKIWVMTRYTSSKLPGMRMNDVIAHALCYGWSDTMLLRKQDNDTFYIRCMPRNPKSVWGSKYRQLATKMTEQGLMRPQGQILIDHAKEINTWDSLDDAANTTIPDDLQQLFDKDNVAFNNFQMFPKASKRWILQWIMAAKRPETRRVRVTQTAELAAKNIKAHHPEAKVALNSIETKEIL